MRLIVGKYSMGTVNGVAIMVKKNTLFVTLIYRLCHSILSILKPVFRQIQQIHCIYNLLRCLDCQIWQLSSIYKTKEVSLNLYDTCNIITMMPRYSDLIFHADDIHNDRTDYFTLMHTH